ncbi:hypothetical protein ABIA45_000677 [Bradyrhizobium sp. USDA 336]
MTAAQSRVVDPGHVRFEEPGEAPGYFGGCSSGDLTQSFR